MNEGYWINYHLKRIVVIVEHEQDIRNPFIMEQLGVCIAKGVLNRFTPIVDREIFLLFIYRNLPLMRVRAHSVFTRFEFASQNEIAPYRMIGRFAKEHFGPAMLISIANFQSGKRTTLNVFPHQLLNIIRHMEGRK